MLPKPMVYDQTNLSEHLQLLINGDSLLRDEKDSPKNLMNFYIQSSFLSRYRLPHPAHKKGNGTKTSHDCPECQKSFNTRQGLNQHIGKVHRDQSKVLPCPVCKKTFVHKYAVKFHVDQVHQKSTRVPCLVCGKDFYNKYELQKHLDGNHPGHYLSE